MPTVRAKMSPGNTYALWIASFVAGAIALHAATGNAAFAIAFLSFALVAAGWHVTSRLEHETRRVEHQRSKAAAAAHELLRVANLTGPDILRDFDGAEPLHRVRIEAVRRFFYQASDIGVTKEEMLRLVGTCDPIVLRDVVNALFEARSPWFDPGDAAWRTAVHYYANGHSDLCHRPVDLQAWSRSIPMAEEYVSRK